MYFITPPSWLKILYGRKLHWFVPGSNEVFLTFDDGPDPEITPEVLEILEKENIKACFFCTGENAEKHPEILNSIISNKHSIGNHTYNHLNGFQSRTEEYVKNVRKCSGVLETKLFRPPYGRIKPPQKKILRKEFDIVLWSVLSGDFDTNLSAADCTANVLRHVKPGSIIVYHDSKKAAPRMLESLPEIIREIKKRNLSFGKLKPSLFRNT